MHVHGRCEHKIFKLHLIWWELRSNIKFWTKALLRLYTNTLLGEIFYFVFNSIVTINIIVYKEGDLNPDIINFHAKETNQYYWAIRFLPTYFLFTYNLIKLEQVKLVCQSRRKFDQRIYAGGSCGLLAAGGKLQYSTYMCAPSCMLKLHDFIINLYGTRPHFLIWLEGGASKVKTHIVVLICTLLRQRHGTDEELKTSPWWIFNPYISFTSFGT